MTEASQPPGWRPADSRLPLVPMTPSQEQLAQELSAVPATDGESGYQAAEALITREVYQAAFELAHKGRPEPDLKGLIPATWVASTLIINRIRPRNFLLPLMLGRVAAQAFLFHRQFQMETADGFARLHREAERFFAARMPELRYVTHPYCNNLLELKILQSFYERIGIRQGKEADLVAALAAKNDGLFASTRQLQKYGIRSAYIADASQLPIVDWHVFRDTAELAGHQLEPDARDNHHRSGTLAEFAGFELPLEDRPAVTATDDSAKKLGFQSFTFTYRCLSENKLVEAGPVILVRLRQDGQLYNDLGVPLAGLAAELGRRPEHELLRGRILSLYTDSVVPAYLIDDSDEIKQAEGRAAAASRVRSRQFLDLVLARQRLIKLRPNLPELIDKEQKSRVRTVRRHGVVGFIKRLPAGHRASQTQRELCRQDQGIELAASGETYVRAHSRGGHKPGQAAEPGVRRARLRQIGGSLIARTDKETKPPLSLPGL